MKYFESYIIYTSFGGGGEHGGGKGALLTGVRGTSWPLVTTGVFGGGSFEPSRTLSWRPSSDLASSPESFKVVFSPIQG